MTVKHVWEIMCKETSVVAQTWEVNIPACLGALRKTSIWVEIWRRYLLNTKH